MECSDCKPDHRGERDGVLLCPLHASARQVTEERDALRAQLKEIQSAIEDWWLDDDYDAQPMLERIQVLAKERTK